MFAWLEISLRFDFTRELSKVHAGEIFMVKMKRFSSFITIPEFSTGSENYVLQKAR